MKGNRKVKNRNPFAYSLQSNLFRQRIVENKKKKVKKYNWRKDSKSEKDYVNIFI